MPFLWRLIWTAARSTARFGGGSYADRLLDLVSAISLYGCRPHRTVRSLFVFILRIGIDDLRGIILPDSASEGRVIGGAGREACTGDYRQSGQNQGAIKIHIRSAR